MIPAAIYLGTLFAHWRKLVVAGLIGLVIGLPLSLAMPHQFVAGRLLVIKTQAGVGYTDLSQGTALTTAQANALTYIGNLSSTVGLVHNAIDVPEADKAGLKIAVVVPPNTSYLQITATANSADAAVKAAKQAATILQEASPAVSAKLAAESTAKGAAATDPNAVVLEDITPSNDQSLATPTGLARWVLPVALMLALPPLLYLALTLRSVIRPQVGESLDLASRLPFTLLGQLHQSRGQKVTSAVPTPDHFRVLSRAGLLETDGPSKVITLTKVEGRSDCRPALSLGQALSQIGRKVVVVDADVASPSMALDDISDDSLGLAHALEGVTKVGTVAQRWYGDISVIPTAQRETSTRLLSLGLTDAMIKELRELYDVVLISAASTSSGPDSTLASIHSDEVMLLVESSTRVDRLIDAGELLPKNLLAGAIVLESAPPRGTRRFGLGTGNR